MQRYVEQLFDDITISIDQVQKAPSEGYDLFDWISEEEEERTAPIRNLQEWTGIYQEMLPPENMLTNEQVHLLLKAMNRLLDAYNCSFVLQIEVPERIQYATIRDNFNQDIKVKTWHMGFFALCKPNTEHGRCTLGEYCQCAFYADLFSDCIDEELSPEEERARALEIEVKHIQRKYGEDWMKYYPYHLDKEYDDEYGNPYNYGMDEEEDEW
ncbi:MAG: hypothetical protein ACJ751_17850 [Niastella sp.]|uniref:hypothetical protein n=1 Tax=Niastella sp. TaxID=1869183 RepID=UPI00389B2FBB